MHASLQACACGAGASGVVCGQRPKRAAVGFGGTRQAFGAANARRGTSCKVRTLALGTLASHAITIATAAVEGADPARGTVLGVGVFLLKGQAGFAIRCSGLPGCRAVLTNPSGSIHELESAGHRRPGWRSKSPEFVMRCRNLPVNL